MKQRCSRPNSDLFIVGAMLAFALALVAPDIAAQSPVGTLTPVAVAQGPRWIGTGSLNIPREGHTATLLADGRVLVVGGHAKEPDGYGDFNDVATDAAEIYDPSTGRWTLTARLNQRRIGHTATLLSDGRVLVAGGEQSIGSWSDGATAEIYDPIGGNWTLTGPMALRRTLHTATLLGSGKVLVAGGVQNRWSEFQIVLAECELFDPATGTWSPTGRLTEAHDSATATLLPNGRVLVVAGHVDNHTVGDTSEIYEPGAGSWAWIYAGDGPGSRVSHTATLLRDGSVLVVGGLGAFGGGKSWVLFDSTSNRWSSIRLRPTARGGHAAALLPDGSALVVGGSDHTGRLLASAESFDPIAGQWSDAPGLGTARSGHTATVLRDGRVLVVGGAGGPVDSHGLLASAELYGVPPPGTITPAYTGSWFDPAQSGHGLHLEVLPGNKFLAAWFTFNPAGTEQAWFLGVGDYVGNTATVTQVAQPTGGRFIPKFDPGQVVNNPWGTLKFTFSDCNHGRVDFDSVRGYGSGSMSLTRLTQPAGLGCP